VTFFQKLLFGHKSFPLASFSCVYSSQKQKGRRYCLPFLFCMLNLYNDFQQLSFTA
jgi:hypothetical protein